MMPYGFSKIKILLVSLVFCFAFSPYVFAQISLSTGVTISASVSDSGQNTNNDDNTGHSSSGGGGLVVNDVSTVRFIGSAKSFSKIFVLRNSVLVASSALDVNSRFSVSVLNLAEGNYNFVLYAEDDEGNRSMNQSFPLVVATNTTVDVSDILIVKKTITDELENQLEKLDSDSVHMIGDFNNSKTVGIEDYSILAYWYEKSNPPKKLDLNKDGIISLIDFSILAYYWTGN